MRRKVLLMSCHEYQIDANRNTIHDPNHDKYPKLTQRFVFAIWCKIYSSSKWFQAKWFESYLWFEALNFVIFLFPRYSHHTLQWRLRFKNMTSEILSDHSNCQIYVRDNNFSNRYDRYMYDPKTIDVYFLCCSSVRSIRCSVTRKSDEIRSKFEWHGWSVMIVLSFIRSYCLRRE